MQVASKAIYEALIEPDPQTKCASVAELRWNGDIPATSADFDPRVPGRPARPSLVQPSQVPHRGLGTVAGRAALIHAVAHIEFNAINLALDACWRFGGLPDAYYRDWLSVAQDEARHFLMLDARLRQLGYAYGDFEAHNGLWEAAEKTSADVMVRMALVPRVLEARGLDVTPGMIDRLTALGDHETTDILGVILEEEVRHVEIGTRWFRHFCAQRELAPDTTFRELMTAHRMRLRLPLNRAARSRAGFSDAELEDAS